MHIEKKTLKNIFIGVASCIILYWLLHSTENVRRIFLTIYKIVSPFLIGAGLAFIFNVPMRAIENRLGWIKRDKARRIAAIVITLLFVLLILALVFYLLIPQLVVTIQDLIPELTDFFTNIGSKVRSYLSEHPKLNEWFVKNTDIENLNWAQIAEKALSVFGNSLSSIVSGMFTAIGTITSALVNTVISVVFAIYCLCQKETLSRQGKKLLYAFAPEKYADKTVEIIKLTKITFSNFLSGQCVEVCILGCMFAVSMSIFKMPYVTLVSVLIAVTAFIPVVGAWVGCACGTFLILVQNPLQAVIFLIMFIVLQLVENNVIYPRVVGTSIGISGMWVLVAVAVGGELLGVGGMFIMIPIAAVIQTLLREMTNKRLKNKIIDPSKIETSVPEKQCKKKLFAVKSKKILSEEMNETSSNMDADE